MQIMPMMITISKQLNQKKLWHLKEEKKIIISKQKHEQIKSLYEILKGKASYLSFEHEWKDSYVLS